MSHSGSSPACCSKAAPTSLRESPQYLRRCKDANVADGLQLDNVIEGTPLYQALIERGATEYSHERCSLRRYARLQFFRRLR